MHSPKLWLHQSKLADSLQVLDELFNSALGHTQIMMATSLNDSNPDSPFAPRHLPLSL